MDGCSDPGLVYVYGLGGSVHAYLLADWLAGWLAGLRETIFLKHQNSWTENKD